MKTRTLVTILCAALAVSLVGCPDPEPMTDAGPIPTDSGTDAGPIDVDAGGPTGFDFRTDAPDAYTRMDRMGMPGVSTALIASKNEYNDSSPAGDVAADNPFVAEIVASIAGLHAALDDDLVGATLVPCSAPGDGTGDCVAQGAPLVLPDTLAIDTSAAAGFPNGRMLADPVMDVTLAVILLDLSVPTQDATTLVGTNPAANDVEFQTEFPFLAPAHE